MALQMLMGIRAKPCPRFRVWPALRSARYRARSELRADALLRKGVEILEFKNER
jgi:hypothetical protein